MSGVTKEDSTLSKVTVAAVKKQSGKVFSWGGLYFISYRRKIAKHFAGISSWLWLSPHPSGVSLAEA